MKGVLVDTSVWVDHFRNGNSQLMELLAKDLAMSHPLVLGEIACGTPPNRVQVLADLERLQLTQQATVRETVVLVDRERLFGLGCGLVDMMLLASVLMSPGVELWTADKNLCSLADRFGVRYQPDVH